MTTDLQPAAASNEVEIENREVAIRTRLAEIQNILDGELRLPSDEMQLLALKRSAVLARKREAEALVQRLDQEALNIASCEMRQIRETVDEPRGDLRVPLIRESAELASELQVIEADCD